MFIKAFLEFWFLTLKIKPNLFEVNSLTKIYALTFDLDILTFSEISGKEKSPDFLLVLDQNFLLPLGQSSIFVANVEFAFRIRDDLKIVIFSFVLCSLFLVCLTLSHFFQNRGFYFLGQFGLVECGIKV